MTQMRVANYIEACQQQLMIKQVSALIGALNGAEKITTTPLPFPYEQLCLFMMCLYILTIPFALVASTGVWTPFFAIMIVMGFAGINAVGEELKNPFGSDENDLDLDKPALGLFKDLKCIISLPSEDIFAADEFTLASRPSI